jgi:hypothetical protein
MWRQPPRLSGEAKRDRIFPSGLQLWGLPTTIQIGMGPPISRISTAGCVTSVTTRRIANRVL